MGKEDKIYNLEEREEPIYSIENEADAMIEKTAGETKRKKSSPFTLLLRLMINPTDGWKRLRRERLSPERWASGCFYPLIATASASEFAGLFYYMESGISSLLVNAIITFISFFFGYFISLPLLKMFLPKDTKTFPNSDFGKSFMMSMMSTLAMFYTLYNCLPMFGPILVFLPLWTIYLISKGTRFIKATQSKPISVAGAVSTICIGSPSLMYWIFSMLLN